ncbi:ejaculatory bulb-specific protein 3 [Anabrus simplex]|uniref:ejaculatory bulb-specific protein 3 n=1 Tax=Anabrus simplex TaxID=316456 RepID=UPI0034DD59E7
MQSSGLLFTVALLVVVAVECDRITTAYDDVDLDRILSNRRLVNNYVNCLLERGPCTPEGRELKKQLPDALHNECERCSEKQKKGAEKVIRHLSRNYPNQWKQLLDKYDPQGVYQKKFSDKL